jgi:hypothetical protein
MAPSLNPSAVLRASAICLFSCFQPLSARAQKPQANYDETAIGAYTLPDPLKMADGAPIRSAADWAARRRPELLQLFEEHVYGRTPTRWGSLQFDVRETRSDALNGVATRKLVHISLKEHPAWPGLDLLLYLPKHHDGPVPCFVGLNFKGNHGATWERDVPVSANFIRDAEADAAQRKTPPPEPETTRGIHYRRWVPEQIIAAGYGVATAYYGDLEPDNPDGWKRSLRGALSPNGADTAWKENEWGAIGAWAWGLSRILDFLETVPEVDAKRCAVVGHSRLGKTSLWAAAQDERFSVALSNDSGEGGAALMRRNYGETVGMITKRFPYWFARRFNAYADNEANCPVDQHLLVALMAPRPVAIGSAVEDRWADPLGEFLSAYHAGPVYALFGKKGIPSINHPPIGQSVGDTVGYHIREGVHDMISEDWVHYLNFCKRHWGK